MNANSTSTPESRQKAPRGPRGPPAPSGPVTTKAHSRTKRSGTSSTRRNPPRGQKRPSAPPAPSGPEAIAEAIARAGLTRLPDHGGRRPGCEGGLRVDPAGPATGSSRAAPDGGPRHPPMVPRGGQGQIVGRTPWKRLRALAHKRPVRGGRRHPVDQVRRYELCSHLALG